AYCVDEFCDFLKGRDRVVVEKETSARRDFAHLNVAGAKYGAATRAFCLLRHTRTHLSLSKIVPDHLPVFHHELDSFQLMDIGDRIAGYGNEVGKFSRLDFPDPVGPA